MKKNYILFTMIFALLGINLAWGETVTFDGTADWGNNGTGKFYPTGGFKITNKSNVTFSLSNNLGDCIRQWNDGSNNATHQYFYLNSCSSGKEDKMAQLTWSVDEGYTINVSKIYFYSYNKKPLWQSTGKGYVRTSRTPNGEQKVREADSWGDATYDADGVDGSSELFGETPTPLTNNEYFILKATSQEWQIKTITLTYEIKANNYTITLDNQEATTAGTESIVATFDANTNLTTAITTPTKNGQVFEGYYTAANGEGVKVIDKDGIILADVKDATNTYIDADKKWKYADNITLYANWVDLLTPEVTCAQTTFKVDDELTDAFTFIHTDGITWEYANKNINAINNGDGFVVEYDEANNKLIAHNAGTVKIVFTQLETETVSKATFEFEFTVSKYKTEFTWYSGAVYRNSVINDFWTSNNTETEVEESTSSDAVATLANGTLTTYYAGGDLSVTVEQEENYKWEGKKETKEYTVGSQANHVPFTLDGDNQASINVASRNEGTVAWDSNGYKMSDGTFTSSKTNIVILKLEGIPDTLHFSINAEKSGVGSWAYYPASGNYNFEVFESASGDDEDWSKIEWGFENDDWFDNKYLGDNDAKRHIKVALSPTTRYIKLRYHGTCWGRFENISVGELKQFAAEDVEFGDVEFEADTVKTLVFKHANAGYNVSVELEEEGETKHFSIDHLTVANTGGDKWGEEEFVITYSTDETGSHAATVTFTDILGNKKVVNLTGMTRITPNIVSAPTATEIKQGEALSASELHNGEASTAGTFAWKDNTIVPESVGAQNFTVVFTPSDLVNYRPVELEVEVQVNDSPTAIDEAEEEVKATKIMRNGQIFIIREGKVYNMQGLRVE